MPRKILCNRCGGILSVDDSLSVCSCLYCGARNIVAEGEVYHEMDHKTDREELFTRWVKNVVYNPEEGIAIGALEKRFIIEYPDDIRCKIFKYDMGSFVDMEDVHIFRIIIANVYWKEEKLFLVIGMMRRRKQ